MSGPPRIILYAELLKNIRQVSVGCSLPSDCTSYTEASLSADSQQLTVHHEGEECTLRLPAAVSAPRKLRVSDGKHLSWRMPLAEAAPPGREPYSQPESEVVAWSAAQLPRGGAVKCRGCRNTVVRELLIGEWKDLPSENWAEMMEFWHCHKPDTEGHDHGQAVESQAHLAGRGYGANSRIAGQSKIGLVDLTSLLFSEEDCTNLTVSQTVSLSFMFLWCIFATLFTVILCGCPGYIEGGQISGLVPHSINGVVTDTHTLD